MIRRTQRCQKWLRLPLAAAVAAGISAPASAFQFYLGDIEGAFDTQLTAGASWRTEDPDRRLISQGNLGVDQNGQPIYGNTNVGASSNNYDDGNLNFEKGETFSKIVKGNSELYLNLPVYGEYLTRVGGFARARYWYDFELKDEMLAVDPSGQRRQLNSEVDDNASGAELLDAYIWTDWNFGQTPVTFRYGKQVVSWGESTFIQNGINVINPVDVPALRAPGAELKEGLLPVEMFYSSIGVTENVTLEGFVQMDWQKTRPDDCGTFFSTNDFASDGCGPVLLGGQLPDYQALQAGLISERLGDREADEKDQFGVAMRWYVPQLNDSELGFYYIRYNNRLPIVSGVVKEAPATGDRFPEYYIEYPEGINLYGVSINTNVPGGYSLGAEYSFKEDVPLQWNAFELIHGGLADEFSLLRQKRVAEAGGDINSLYGQPSDGYDRYDISQLQATIIKFYDQILGASRMAMVAEVGATYVHSLPDKSEAVYGRSGTFGVRDFSEADGYVDSSGNPTSCEAQNINPSNCSMDGFTTSFSWGYRARFSLEYPNLFSGVNVSPGLYLAHDVKGYSPEPGANFVEGRKQLGLSLSATYLNKYQAGIGYTNFFGGKPYNELTDRDFVSASMSVSF
ncbi:MAG: peptide ABC transporter substrate-binding protein [Alteromonadaceae bacterium]|nr:peptide ABC transporter substrate-binding protein [Alteromonadaceae bacterium]